MKVVKQEIEEIAIAIRAYNHPMRQHILEALSKTPGLTVGELVEKFRCEQSVASQHLAILRRADLVSTKPRGKYIQYFVKETSIKQLKNLAAHWENNTEPQPSRPLILSSLALAAM